MLLEQIICHLVDTGKHSEYPEGLSGSIPGVASAACFYREGRNAVSMNTSPNCIDYVSSSRHLLA